MLKSAHDTCKFFNSNVCLRHLYYSFVISLILNSVLCNMLKEKKRIREAPRLTPVKKKIQKYLKIFKSLPEIPEAHIVVFPLGQGRGSQELNQNRNCHIYIYIY